MVDYSKLSNEDLINLKKGNYSAISNEGLLILKGESTTPKPKKQGIDLTPSGLVKQATAGAVAPLRAIMRGETIPEAYQRGREIQENSLLNKFSPAVDIGAYLALPQAKIFQGAGLLPTIGNLGISGAYQGGLIGGLEALKRGENVGQGIGAGAAFGGALGTGLPVAVAGGTQAIKILPKTGGFISRTIGRTKPETLAQAVKPNSKALDMNAAQAQQELMNTTEQVRNDYNELLTTKGNRVGNLLNKLRENVVFKASDISNDIDKTFDVYSLSKNPELNPAINATQKEISKIDDLLYGNQQTRLNKFNEEIDKLKFEDAKKEVFRGKSKGGFYTKDAAPLNNALVQADRDFNTYILNDIKNKIAENPEILNNPAYIEKLENNLGNILKNIPLEAQSTYYDKLYTAIDKGGMLEKANATLTPKELYDVNKNISNMVDWDKPGAAMKNSVLEQIYGQNAAKISELSPALAAANKEYAALMDFQKNEGLRRILRQGDNIDAASSALKNYNNTITKGNTGRNVQELEKTLVDAGYEPFINRIDDVNAAQDLLNVERTGDSSLANAAKILTRPALKLARWANQRNLPPVLQRLLRRGEEKTVPLLYGYVSMDDEL